MSQKEAIEKLVAEVLDGTELRLKVDAYQLQENLETGDLKIHCEIHDERSGERQIVEGHGVGLVDATFHASVQLYSAQFPSLQTIRFVDFSVKADLDTGRAAARSDMQAVVTLRIANSEGREFAFSHASRSITRSSIAVVFACVGFFINSERAFIAVYRALQHARDENRPDSVARYTSQLATLVEATSYTEVIEQIRNSELTKNRGPAGR